MNLWLDDVRTPPTDDWVWVKTVDDAKDALLTGSVKYASLDHDLGFDDDRDLDDIVDGIDLVLWMVDNKIWPDKVAVHSSNPSGAHNMRTVIENNGPYVTRHWIKYNDLYPAVLYGRDDAS